MSEPACIRDHSGRPADRIDDRHWQSGFPMPFRFLPSQGVDLVVLAAEAQPTSSDLGFLREHCPTLSIISCPFDDTTDRAALPNITHLAHAVANRVVVRLNQGKCVLITCAAGLNRSGLISALILMKRRGISGREAVARVKAARQGALHNGTFSSYVESLR